MNWLTVPDACHALSISERTLRRRIKAGEYQTKREEGKLLVEVEAPEADDTQEQAVVTQLQSEVEYLREQISRKDEQITQLNTIVMQMSRNQERMLEAADKQREAWYRRIFRRDKSVE